MCNAKTGLAALASRQRSGRAQGFTLVEVLVSLAIMAVLATLTWRGIDGMARTRELSQAATDRSLRLGTVLAQWERDLQAVQPGMGIPAISFDGASMRLLREAEGGLQIVSWTVRDASLWRWAAPVTTSASDLEEAWLRSQQLLGDEPGTLKMSEGVSGWQVYFYRGNGWSNPQSTADRVAVPARTPPTAGAAASAPAAAQGALPAVDLLPSGVRLQLTLVAGMITRDVLMSGQGY